MDDLSRGYRGVPYKFEGPVPVVLIDGTRPEPKPDVVHKHPLLRVIVGYTCFMGMVVAVIYILCQVFLPIKQ